jgi:hypothetical protein
MAAHDEQEPPEWNKKRRQWRSKLGFGNWQKNEENGM